MVDLRQVQAFVAVVEERSFTRAAERLNIGQSGLSQQVKKLERTVGGSLFQRDSHSVAITDLGRSMYRPAQQLLAASEHFERSADPTPSNRTLTMAVAENGVNAIALEALSRVRDAFRDIDLEIRRVTLREQHEALRDGVEAVLARPPYTGELADGIAHYTVRIDPVVVVVHQSDPNASLESVSAAEVATWERVPLTWTPASWGAHSELLVAGDTEPVAPQLAVDTFRDASAVVSIHRVACVMPESFAKSYNVADVVAIPIDDIEPMRIELLVQHDSGDPLVDRLAELLELTLAPDETDAVEDLPKVTS